MKTRIRPTFVRAILASSLLLLVTANAWALGLGDIQSESHLNQPFEARIPLVSATTRELATLNVRLAPQAAFERAGLDTAPVLDELQFEIVTDQGSPYIRVTTEEVVREPFLSFLIEARWGQGRLVREYTVLLDPPLLMEGEPEPTAAPTVQKPSPSRQAPADAQTAVTEAPAPSEPVTEERDGIDAESEYGPVPRGDTLWEIARQVRPDQSVSINQIMLAIYRRNPDAFAGNINRLRAGAVLRIPPAASFARIDSRVAFAEVREQNRQWRQSQPAASETAQAEAAPPTAEPAPARSSGPRLQLVPADESEIAQADEGSEESGAAGGDVDPEVAALERQLEEAREQALASTEESAALKERLSQLEKELEDTRRLLTLRNEELAAVQAQLSTQQRRQPSEQSEAQAPADEPAPETPAGETSQAASAPPAATPAGEPSRPAVSPPGGLLSWVRDPMVIGALALLVLLGGLLVYRRRQGEAADELADGGGIGEADHEPTDDGGIGEADDERLVGSGPSVYADPTDEPVDEPEDESFIEDGHEDDETQIWADEEDDRDGVEKTLGVDADDPLAEADFNVSYGLYDDALAVVEKALETEPGRRDLKLKRLEVLFAASETQAFLEHARAMAEEPQGMADSYWERAAIMGRQLFPDDPLFEEGEGETASSDEDFLDLDLETSQGVAADGFSEEGTYGTGAFEIADESEAEGDRQEEDDALTGPGSDDEAAWEPTAAQDGERFDLDMADEEGASAPETVVESSGSPSAEADETSSEDEAETKLDLAKAYIGMDEFADARRVLDEVTRAGSEVQRNEAAELLAQIETAGQAADDGATQVLSVEEQQDPEGSENRFEIDLDQEADLPAGEDDVDTKLDLARAYIGMEDNEGARDLIQEVMAEGNDEQRRQAEELLAQIS